MRFAVTALIILPAACSELCSHSYGRYDPRCNYYGRGGRRQDEQLMGFVFLIVLLLLAMLIKCCCAQPNKSAVRNASAPSELI